MSRETDKTNSKVGESTVKNDKQKVLRLILSITTVLSILMLFVVFICLSLGQKIACISCTALLVGFGITSCVLLAIIVSLNKNKKNSIGTLEEVKEYYITNNHTAVDTRAFSSSVREDARDECFSIKNVNEYVQKFEKDEQVLTIVNNFVASNECNIFALEYTFLPIYKTKNLFNSQVDYKIKKNDESFQNQCGTDYIGFISKFSQETIDNDESKLRSAYLLRDYTGAPINAWIKPSLKEQFLNIYNLFLALYHQNVISVKTSLNEAYYAFLFVTYMAKKKYFFNSAKIVLESYGLSINDNEETIIDTLYNNDIEEGEITSYILASNSIKHDYLDIWNEEIDKLKQIVSSRINSIKEKEKIKKLSEKNQEQETVRFDINDIDLMTGAQFEWFISYLFSKLGYSTEITKTSGDQGIDIIAKKGNAVVAIQTKCYSKPVGNHAIMEAVAGSKYYKANKTIVVTNSVFTKSARELAIANGVVLWDRVVLKEKIDEINE